MAKELVIIGGGPAATNAVETIRQYSSEDKITLISSEPAHSRMALPYWVAGQIPREQSYTGDADSFSQLQVDAKIGSTVSQLDAANKSLTLEDGSQVNFDELLIATGSRPLDLPIPGADGPGVHHLWTLAQTEAVLEDTKQLTQPRVVMIGAGFIGLIVLNAMYKRGWKLSVVEQQSQVLPRMLNSDAANIAKNWLQGRGVDVHTGVSVKAIETTDSGAKRIILSDGSEFETDIVVIGTGVRPNLDLVQGSSIKTDHGILVDDHLRTNVPGIYAAGDCAQGPNLLGGNPEIHAIQPTAVDHGRVAGANMAGQDVTYPGSLSLNVLDVCGLQCASYGHWDDLAADPITIHNPDGSIYRRLLLTDDRITGAIFVGQANDLGMLTDVGMVKGMIQTQTNLGEWKEFLQENPFDIRRAFIATRVPEKLAAISLLGRPTQNRHFRFQQTKATHEPGKSHSTYVNTKS